MNRLSSQLAARQSIRQTEALLQANACGDACDAILHRAWRDLLEAVRDRNFQRVFHLWQYLGHRLAAELHGTFRDLAAWGYTSAANVLKQTLPRTYLQRVPVRLREENEPAVPFTDFLYLLFPPPSKEFIDNILYRDDGIGWIERVTSLTRLASPQTITAAVSQGYVAGENLQQLAKRLLPVVDGVRASARRVARTEGMRIAHSGQMAAHEQLGDLVIGYMVHSSGGPNARHSHALRSGTIYYRHPKPGQLGFDVMPQPPRDNGGPHDDGPPGIKPSCRCYLTPVLRPPSDLKPAELAAFTNNAKQVVPDPLVYSAWFRTANVPHREMAVGVRRYRFLQDQLGYPPAWEDFLDHSGRLMTLDALAAEDPFDRVRRVAQLRAILLQRGQQRRQVATYGFAR